MKKMASWASAIAGLCTAIALASPASAASIAWVSFHAGDDTPSANAAGAGFTEAPDVGYTDLLASAGHIVTRYVSTDNAPPAGVTGHDVIIVSRSSGSGAFQSEAETAAWNGLTTPVIFMHGYTTRTNRLGFMSGNNIPDTAGDVRLTTTNPAHPIFTGIVFDGTNTTVLPYAGIASFMGTPQRGISTVTGPPNPGGQVLATIGTAGDPVFGAMAVGYFPPGTTMVNDGADDVLAGRRLVFLSGSRNVNGVTDDSAGIFDLTPVGEHLFLNAVTFIQNIPEPATPILTMFGMGGLGLLRRKAQRA
jgi:hypothetical protein